MNKKHQLYNNNLLYLVPLFFIVIIIFRIVYSYNDTKNKEYEFAQKEAEVLNSYVMTHRSYYQKLFINKTIPLNSDTLHALPAFSAAPISKEFSKINTLGIIVKTASDRARNPKNMVDASELNAINYFKKNSTEKEYFSDKETEYYQYGYALRIEQKCLKCHGPKETAPKFIQERYTAAYDYKLGEVRGIISIKLPKDILSEYFFKSFIFAVLYDFILLIALFSFIFYLVRKTKNINTLLSNKVDEKTKELSIQNNELLSYAKALDNSLMISKTTPEGVITYVNKKFLKKTGYTQSEIIGKTHKIIQHPSMTKESIQDMWNTIQSKKVWNSAVKGLSKTNETFINKVSIIPIQNENNEIIEYISTRTDITKEMKNKEKIQRNRIYDTLTGLQNRQKLIDDIKESCCNNNHLVLFNIDRFKEINDFYGHDIADKILVEIANKLSSVCTAEKSSIYKLPADEYAIFTSMEIKANEFEAHINAIVDDILETQFSIDGNNIYITFSGGIASNTDNIMVKADMALQNAKDSKKHIITYDDTLDMTKSINKNIEGISLLKQAISENQIEPYFQPIYNIHTKQIEKYECLARIVQSDKVIAPFFFMDIAIKSKLYPKITQNILTKSFEFFKDKDYEFSINLSIEDILNPKTSQFIFDSLDKFSNPSKIVFEILETEKIDNYNELKVFIKNVKNYGCQIAIDDFGSGYSNFAHILELEIDYLKIDASLVRYVSTDENSRKITQTIINFAKNLDMKTIAEFVEDKNSMDILEAMGVDYIQGYYIGKPQVGLSV